MEEQIINALNVAIDAGQQVVVPLAAAGLCAWISPFVRDSKFRVAMRVVNAIGGNVLRARNDGEDN